MNIILKDDPYKVKKGRDLLTVEVAYDDGYVGNAYMTRASFNVALFKQDHAETHMTRDELNEFEALIVDSFNVQASFDEEG